VWGGVRGSDRVSETGTGWVRETGDWLENFGPLPYCISYKITQVINESLLSYQKVSVCALSIDLTPMSSNANGCLHSVKDWWIIIRSFTFFVFVFFFVNEILMKMVDLHIAVGTNSYSYINTVVSDCRPPRVYNTAKNQIEFDFQ